jgi:hypothetical protein
MVILEIIRVRDRRWLIPPEKIFNTKNGRADEYVCYGWCGHKLSYLDSWNQLRRWIVGPLSRPFERRSFVANSWLRLNMTGESRGFVYSKWSYSDRTFFWILRIETNYCLSNLRIDRKKLKLITKWLNKSVLIGIVSVIRVCTDSNVVRHILRRTHRNG